MDHCRRSMQYPVMLTFTSPSHLKNYPVLHFERTNTTSFPLCPTAMASLPSFPQAFSYAIGGAAATADFSALSKHTAPSYTRSFGLPDRASWYHFIGVMGARNVAIGLSMMSFAFREDWKGVGTLMTCSTFCGLVDTVITWKYGRRESSYVHIAGTMVMAVGGWFLLSV